MQANTFASNPFPMGRSRPNGLWRMCILSLSKGIIGLVLVALAAGATMAATDVTGVNVVNKSDRVVITVNGSGPLKMAVLTSGRGSYLGFQFQGHLLAKGRLVSISSGRIYNVRYSRFREKPPLTRVVLNTTSHLDYSTQWNDGRSRVEITVWKFGASPGKATSEPVMGSKKTNVAALPSTESIQVLPPVEISGAQGSDTAEPAEAPVVTVKPAPPASKVTTHVARIAPPARPVRVAQASAKPASFGAGKAVSLNFLGADINDVLKALATQSGENIVASKDVKGEVTVSLSDVTLEEALDYVAKLSGFGYIRSNGTYLVGSKDALRSMTGEVSVLSTSEVVPVKYTNCDDVLALIKAQWPDVQATKVSMREANKSAANTQGPEPESSIVLSGPAASIAGAKLLVQQVDIPGENDQATYRVKYVDPNQLAKTLRRLVPAVYVEGLGMTASEGGDSGGSGTAGAVGAAPGASQSASSGSGSSGGQGTTATNISAADLDNLSRTLVITGRKGDVEKARTLIEALDVKSPQIKIEAKITSISENGGKTLGLKWGDWGSLSVLEGSIVGSVVDTAVGTVAGGVVGSVVDTVTTVFDTVVDTVAGTTTDQTRNRTSTNTSENTSDNTRTDSYTKGSGKFFRQPLGFSAKIDALVESGNATLLASPNLLCLEGKLGTFFAGDEVTYVSSVSASASGEKTYQTSTVQAGVTLRVVGSVSSDGYITLALHPEVSTYSLFTQGSVTVPTVSSRYTDNVVRVKSGTTIAIGGLIRSDEIKSMSKIPLLGDLPFFGKLFRHVQNTSSKDEIVMFLTASVVND